MTVLENSIRIAAPREKVWSVLASLDALERYDPGIRKSEIASASKEGLGAVRRCEVASGGWFEERVVAFRPPESLAFELVECSLPLRRLSHSYTLTREGDSTLVRQRMEYDLKLGPLGKLIDGMVVRKRWDDGIRGFFRGLKHYVETGERPPGKGTGARDRPSGR